MAGDVANTQLWQGADVYVGPVATAAPTDCTTAWAAGWEAAGLLDGEEGFTMTREEDTEEHFAWGQILVRKTHSKHKRTLAFTALEDNDVTFALVNPGSTRTTVTGLTTAKVVIPRYEDFAVGFELREGNVVKRRTVKRATIEEVDEFKESETELAVYTVTIVILPETDGELYQEILDADITTPLARKVPPLPPAPPKKLAA